MQTGFIIWQITKPTNFYNRKLTLFKTFISQLVLDKFVNWAMVDINMFRKLALSFPGATEQPHFEKPSFRVAKKIFATFDSKNNIACIKLSAIDQDVFCAFDKAVIYPVPNKFGSHQGWTFINLQKVRKDMFTDALKAAYIQVAPKKLTALMK